MAVDDGLRPVQCFDLSSQDEAETEEFVRQKYVGNRSRLGVGRGGAHSARRSPRPTAWAPAASASRPTIA
jgi:hypothetical protein